MTNYNPKQNIERQLELPGMELETSIKPTSKKPKKKMDLIDKVIIWSSIGLVSLALGGGVSYARYKLEGVGTTSSPFGNRDPCEIFSEVTNDLANKYLWKNTDSEDYANRFKTKTDLDKSPKK